MKAITKSFVSVHPNRKEVYAKIMHLIIQSTSIVMSMNVVKTNST